LGADLILPNNKEPIMSKPSIEPTGAYENLHLVARDYLDRLRQSLDALPTPDEPMLRWQTVHTMSHVNECLAEAGELLDQLKATTI
jgi:hypothetical protein